MLCGDRAEVAVVLAAAAAVELDHGQRVERLPVAADRRRRHQRRARPAASQAVEPDLRHAKKKINRSARLIANRQAKKGKKEGTRLID